MYAQIFRRGARAVGTEAAASAIVGVMTRVFAPVFALLAALFMSCAGDISATVHEGEWQLAQGNLASAQRLADKALASGAGCECANAFAAALYRAKMLRAIAGNLLKVAEAARERCQYYAGRAWTLAGVSTQVLALRDACRPSTVALLIPDRASSRHAAVKRPGKHPQQVPEKTLDEALAAMGVKTGALDRVEAGTLEAPVGDADVLPAGASPAEDRLGKTPKAGAGAGLACPPQGASQGRERDRHSEPDKRR